MRYSAWLASVVAATAFVPAAGAGQNIFKTAGHDLRDGVRDVGFVLASPARADRKDWLVFGGAIAATGLISLADDDVDSWIVKRNARGDFDSFEFFLERRDPKDIDWSDVGTGHVLSKVSLGVWAVGLIVDSENLRDAGMGCITTWLPMSGARDLNYLIWSRRRPADAPGDQYQIHAGQGPWIDRSFLSGHFANPVGCSAFLSERFELGALEPLMYATAVGVGASRMIDRRHWLSDIALSAALGYATGKMVARRQLSRRGKR
jgi:hypothetical protein